MMKINGWFMTLDEVSNQSGLTENHLRRLIRAGTLKGIKVNQTSVVTEKDFKKFMLNRVKKES